MSVELEPLAGDSVLELQDLVLCYGDQSGDRRVLDGVSLSLKTGETLGIAGRNGCGKSGILRVMAGIFAPTAGVVRRRRGATVSLLTLGLGFKPNLSGADNALLSAMLQGASLREALCLPQIAEFSELGRAFDDPVKTYSTGMRARLGFATSLTTRVDVLLIDEVLSVGDVQFRVKAEAAMRERLGGNQTVVFVSHAPGQMKSLCQRVIWIDGGQIVAEGDPETVMQAYHRAVLPPKS